MLVEVQSLPKDQKQGRPKRGQKPVKPKKEPDTPMNRLKWEVARELGLYEKAKRGGWGTLTAAETGRIGGLMTKRLKEAGQPPRDR